MNFHHCHTVLNKCSCLNKHVPVSFWQPTPKFWLNGPPKQMKIGEKWPNIAQKLRSSSETPDPTRVSATARGVFIQHNVIYFRPIFWWPNTLDSNHNNSRDQVGISSLRQVWCLVWNILEEATYSTPKMWSLKIGSTKSRSYHERWHFARTDGIHSI